MEQNINFFLFFFLEIIVGCSMVQRVCRHLDISAVPCLSEFDYCRRHRPMVLHQVLNFKCFLLIFPLLNKR